jgi:hypothetical protein
MVQLIINANFCTTIQIPGKQKQRIQQGVTGIVVNNLPWENPYTKRHEGVKIRQELNKHKPGENWHLCGYVLVTEKEV